MCLIVDEDVAWSACPQHKNPDFEPIKKWLESRRGILVLCKELWSKVKVNQCVQKYFYGLWQSGLAEFAKEEWVTEEMKRLERMSLCSNDILILALARASGARTLYTKDGKLMKDFRNMAVVPRPKGKIYSGPKTAHTLSHTLSCLRKRRRRSAI